MELNLTKEQQLILIGIIASIIVGLGVMACQHYFARPADNIPVEAPKMAAASAPEIIVHISGAVRREGVYKLKYGDRLLDALNEAGGAAANADLSVLNLAEVVKDGEKIMVPAKQAPAESVYANQPGGAAAAAFQKVNINTADETALDSLPGVGPATAKAIVEYRRTNGPFCRPEQITEIPRFGKAKFEKIKDKITL